MEILLFKILVILSSHKTNFQTILGSGPKMVAGANVYLKRYTYALPSGNYGQNTKHSQIFKT